MKKLRETIDFFLMISKPHFFECLRHSFETVFWWLAKRGEVCEEHQLADGDWLEEQRTRWRRHEEEVTAWLRWDCGHRTVVPGRRHRCLICLLARRHQFYDQCQVLVAKKYKMPTKYVLLNVKKNKYLIIANCQPILQFNSSNIWRNKNHIIWKYLVKANMRTVHFLNNNSDE